ncbi:MAG: DUF4389 domain-containing protein [Gammaproteobacteria bacterium]|nr:DUF4389 domain-containing protein [Gammaproteobacteria bacterium]
MKEETKAALIEQHKWQRFMYMIAFAFVLQTGGLILMGIVIFQFIKYLLNGEPQARLSQFSESLAIYVYQVVRFLTFASDDKPFPFAPWPSQESELKHNLDTQN